MRGRPAAGLAFAVEGPIATILLVLTGRGDRSPELHTRFATTADLS